MSLRKSRFIHFQTLEKNTPLKGFTVFMEPYANLGGDVEVDANEVRVSIALCHKVDHFCRKQGRIAAMTAETQVVKVVDLPMFLARLKAKCYGVRLKTKQAERTWANSFAWVWKYFL
jgi:hypothetical protein